MNTMRKFQTVITFTLLFSLLAVGVALAAASVTLNSYQIDFIEANQSGNLSTWTYAVTANADAMPLDQWTLSIDKTCTYLITTPLTSPVGQRSYTTPTSYVLQKGANAGSDICATTYNCQAASYSVGNNRDLLTNLTGIWFLNADQQLSGANPVTHIFQFTLFKSGVHHQGDVATAITVPVSNSTFGQVTGPVCPPTAVNLVSLSASSAASRNGIWLTGLVAGLLVAGLGLVAYRRIA